MLYKRRGKRALDVTMAVAGLLVSSPVLALTAAAVWLEDGKPVLFSQTRAGSSGSTFTIRKFRSMPVHTADIPSADACQLRVTRIGERLRRTGLDELPQLWNVLRGEMSLVGPRPALPSQVDLLSFRHQNLADDLRPGVTGLAQVRAYDGMPEKEKAAHDVEYAAEITLLKDLRILVRTVHYLRKPPPTY